MVTVDALLMKKTLAFFLFSLLFVLFPVTISNDLIQFDKH